MRVWSLILVAVMLYEVEASAVDVIPKGWLLPEYLESAEDPIQRQLDTGLAMGPTAWDMATVKDARLLLIYLKLYEQLPDELSRRKLLSEQEDWLQRRRKAVGKLATPDGGSAVTLDMAAKQMELTEERIAELQKRLDLKKNGEPDTPATGASPGTPRDKAGAAPSEARR